MHFIPYAYTVILVHSDVDSCLLKLYFVRLLRVG